ncbi:MAG TPA: DNA-3-methyladenine glycosylase [Pirellulaceae bacterium]|jgi:DNA-3-methyladenine glycosylase II|nr:DNA-3-methyladenine glycosylase [Pirellulaceae bacterium]
MTIADKARVAEALSHLKKCDPILRKTIQAAGPFTLKADRDRFGMLVRSILGQQISVAAARSIRLKLEALAGSAGLTPARLAELSHEELRGAGLSKAKALYVHDLAAKATDGTIRFDRIARRSDEEVIAELVQVKGVGVWTAQMFMIFSLGRLDVFPHDDLGVRAAIRNLYGLDELPTKAKSHEIAAPWRPYATIASWYCWRSLEVAKAAKAGKVPNA